MFQPFIYPSFKILLILPESGEIVLVVGLSSIRSTAWKRSVHFFAVRPCYDSLLFSDCFLSDLSDILRLAQMPRRGAPF